MPFPIIITLAVAAAKATTSYVAWYWGGAGAAGLGGVIYYNFKSPEPVLEPLRPSETPLHKIGGKI